MVQEQVSDWNEITTEKKALTARAFESMISVCFRWSQRTKSRKGALDCPQIPWQQCRWAHQVKVAIQISLLNH